MLIRSIEQTRLPVLSLLLFFTCCASELIIDSRETWSTCSIPTTTLINITSKGSLSIKPSSHCSLILPASTTITNNGELLIESTSLTSLGPLINHGSLVLSQSSTNFSSLLNHGSVVVQSSSSTFITTLTSSSVVLINGEAVFEEVDIYGITQVDGYLTVNHMTLSESSSLSVSGRCSVVSFLNISCDHLLVSGELESFGSVYVQSNSVLNILGNFHSVGHLFLQGFLDLDNGKSEILGNVTLIGEDLVINSGNHLIVDCQVLSFDNQSLVIDLSNAEDSVTIQNSIISSINLINGQLTMKSDIEIQNLIINSTVNLKEKVNLKIISSLIIFNSGFNSPFLQSIHLFNLETVEFNSSEEFVFFSFINLIITGNFEIFGGLELIDSRIEISKDSSCQLENFDQSIALVGQNSQILNYGDVSFMSSFVLDVNFINVGTLNLNSFNFTINSNGKFLNYVFLEVSVNSTISSFGLFGSSSFLKVSGELNILQGDLLLQGFVTIESTGKLSNFGEILAADLFKVEIFGIFSNFGFLDVHASEVEILTLGSLASEGEIIIDQETKISNFGQLFLSGSIKIDGTSELHSGTAIFGNNLIGNGKVYVYGGILFSDQLNSTVDIIVDNVDIIGDLIVNSSQFSLLEINSGHILLNNSNDIDTLKMTNETSANLSGNSKVKNIYFDSFPLIYGNGSISIPGGVVNSDGVACFDGYWGSFCQSNCQNFDDCQQCVESGQCKWEWESSTCQATSDKNLTIEQCVQDEEFSWKILFFVAMSILVIVILGCIYDRKFSKSKALANESQVMEYKSVVPNQNPNPNHRQTRAWR
ncbi:hypothetical protein P9112_013136 [Eukaryota sp. TZLM1-RC]